VDGLAGVLKLLTLYLSENTALTSVEGLAVLPELKTLDLKGCTALERGLARIHNSRGAVKPLQALLSARRSR